MATAYVKFYRFFSKLIQENVMIKSTFSSLYYNWYALQFIQIAIAVSAVEY